MDFVMKHYFDDSQNGWAVTLSGEVDIFNAEQMKTQLLALIDDKQGRLLIDCKDLKYIDSTALGALVGVLKAVQSYGGEVCLRHVRPNLAKLFKITNLDRVFTIEGDEYGQQRLNT